MGMTDEERALKKRKTAIEWNKAKRASDPFAWAIIVKRRYCITNGIAFDLDADYVRSLVPKDNLCPIMGTSMVMPGEEGPFRDRMSIDRLDPAGGYVKGNIMLMSNRANMHKGDCMDPAVFRRLADLVESFR